MSEHRPVFLVATTAGTIVGPYHAGCAEKITLGVQAKLVPDWADAEKFGEWVRKPREETLPW